VWFFSTPCFLMCMMFSILFIWIHVYAFAIHFMVHCGSTFEPGASWLPYYCTSICVRSWCNWRASCADSTTTKKDSKPKKDCLEDARCLSCPSGGGTIDPWALRFWIVRDIDCGDWLAREYMPAHQHCDVVLPTRRGSDWVCHKLGNAPVFRSGTGSWVLRG